MGTWRIAAIATATRVSMSSLRVLFHKWTTYPSKRNKVQMYSAHSNVHFLYNYAQSVVQSVIPVSTNECNSLEGLIVLRSKSCKL